MPQKRKTFIIIASLVIVTIILVAFYGYRFASFSTDREGFIFIHPGATTESVADSVANTLGKEYASHVKLILDIESPDWSRRIGAYKISSGTNAYRTAKKLAAGAQTPIRFTFNNVRTLEQLAERFDHKFRISKEEFLAVALSDSVLQRTGTTRQTAGVIYFPDTYELYWTASANEIINLFYKYYTRFWNEERKNKASKLGLSPIEVSILASIVEEETNNKQERGIVARLYMNRLNRSMALQADPTVKFALGDFARRRITRADLTINSPYNTYRNLGLPPGPIRIPEKSTLEAVINAPMNDYLYMCAKEDFSGRHNFTSSYNIHQQNAQRYRQALNRRGITR